MGDVTDLSGVTKKLLRVYTKNYFVEMLDDASQVKIEDNIFKDLQFFETNKSKAFCMPKINEDDYRLAILAPILISDLNYAVKYQCFSILYSIDLDTGDFKFDPRVINSTKTAAGENQGKLGTIKPEVDITEVMSFAKEQISLWLSTRGIKAGSIGKPNEQLSGLAKIIDESDSFEARKKAIEHFKRLEQRLWKTLTRKIHPEWVARGVIAESRPFSNDIEIEVIFPDPKPLMSRTELLDELDKELRLGLTTKKEALKRLHPNTTEEGIEELLEDLENERSDQANNQVEVESDETAESADS